jgi:hypothetical protein
MELPRGERDLLLAAVFELQITRSAFDRDPKRDLVPLVSAITPAGIEALVRPLSGDMDAVYFGAFKDTIGAAPVPEYPADESDEG